MAGQFTRTHDDDCFINSRNIQSDAPFRYNLYMGQQKNCVRCLPTYGTIPIGNWYDSHELNRVDIETVLKNQSYPHIGCGRDNYRHLDTSKQNKDNDSFCGKWQTPTNTLLSHPKEYFRELSIDRFFEFAGMQPQQSYLKWDYEVNTRLQAKDGFVQQYPTPISINPALPGNQRTAKNNWT